MSITKYSQSVLTLPTVLEDKVKNIKGLDDDGLLEDCLTITLLIYLRYPQYITLEEIRELSGICLSRIKELLSMLVHIGLIKVINIENRIEAAVINKAQLYDEQPLLRKWLKRFDYCNFPNKEHAELMEYFTSESALITLLVLVLSIVLFASVVFV